MAWTIYLSSDSGAPTLTGVAGSLTTLLDAVLVNGYGAKSAAGWTIKHTATNKRCYRMGSGSITPMDVVINDDGTVSNAREAWMIGWEDCTGISGQSGTGTAQGSFSLNFGGGYIRKSSTLDATVRNWMVAADERTFILYCGSQDINLNSYGVYFGEFYSYLSGEQYGVISIPRSATGGLFSAQALGFYNTYGGAAATGAYVPRTELGAYITSGGINCAICGPQFGNAGGVPGLLTFPSPVDGSLWISRHYVAHTTYNKFGIRGHLRGFWHPQVPGTTFLDGSTFPGIGPLAGKSFITVGSVNAASSSGAAIFLETTSTVEANS